MERKVLGFWQNNSRSRGLSQSFLVYIEFRNKNFGLLVMFKIAKTKLAICYIGREDCYNSKRQGSIDEVQLISSDSSLP